VVLTGSRLKQFRRDHNPSCRESKNAAGDLSKCLIILKKLVLPDRIELSTSPLPMVGVASRSAQSIRLAFISRTACTDFAHLS
jgi:hypothetical protein